MARKLKPATGYVEPSVIELLKEQAKAEHRSVSSLVALILTEHVKTRAKNQPTEASTEEQINPESKPEAVVRDSRA